MGSTFEQDRKKTGDVAKAAQISQPKAKAPSTISKADAIMEAEAPEVDSATKAELLAAVDAYVAAAFTNLERGLDEVKKALDEPKKPPPKGIALEFIAGLVGTLTEFALNDVTAGVYSIAKSTLKHTTIEALHETTEVVSQKIGKLTESGVSHHLEGGEDGEKKSAEKNKLFWANPSSKTYVDEYAYRQAQSLTDHKANVNAELILGKLSRASAGELRQLTAELQSMTSDRAAEVSSRFQTQVVVGWLNFSTRISLGDRELPQGAPARSAFDPTSALPAHGEWMEAGGAIDVTVKVPRTVQGARGLSLDSLTVDSGEGVARTLRHSAPRLMDTPALRRIWLRTEAGKLGTSCAIVIYPNGSMSINLKDPTLSSIGSMVPTDRTEDTPPMSETFSKMGAQQLLNWLQPQTLEQVQ